MNKRPFSILAAVAMVASAFSLAPAKATPEIPSDEDANIVDQAGDANYHSPFTGSDAGPSLRAADILKVWFTHDDQNISVHFLTDGSVSVDSHLYRVWVDPGVGDTCMAIQGVSEGMGNEAQSSLRLLRDCGDGSTEEAGEFSAVEGPDETGIWTITLPRSMNDAFRDGGVLATPWADTSHNIPGVVRGAPAIDDTEEGKDYAITSGGGTPKAKPAGKKKGADKGNKKCAKIKNKKKKKRCKKQQKRKRKKPQRACGAYRAGELGAGVETIRLTAAATEEEPVEQTVELDATTANFNPVDDVTTAYFNVQANTNPNRDVGLWVLFEFPSARDYDLALFYPDGSYGARARGFNTAPNSPISNPGHGGEHGLNYEKLLGIRTARCGGWTVEASNHFGEGGEFDIKLWLGEIETDPLAPGEETP